MLESGGGVGVCYMGVFLFVGGGEGGGWSQGDVVWRLLASYPFGLDLILDLPS